VSFVGGGSDLPPGLGAVVNSAIDKYVYCVARKRLDSKIYLTWREKEVVDDPKDLHHEIVRESINEVGWGGGVELLLFSDIPGVGSGLGSSAATCVGGTPRTSSTHAGWVTLRVM
jgi:D-glycero-alpha-D-manno-heptose-7-phosphate kinase